MVLPLGRWGFDASCGWLLAAFTRHGGGTSARPPWWGCPTPRPACRPACGRDFRGPCCMRCLRGCVLAGSAAVAGREAVVMTGGTLLPVVSGVLSWCWGARGGSACLAHPVGVRALSGSRTSAYGTPRDVCACR
eukprot:207869-Prymnesium_polylepis.1